MARRLRTLEAMLDVRVSHANQRAETPFVPRQQCLDPDTFHRDYYSRNLPVIITDVIQPLPAFANWSFAHLRRRFGQEKVELQANRRSNPIYEVFLKGHTIEMRFGEFLERIEKGGPSNEFYLTANDRLLENPAFARLLEEIKPLPKYFTPDVTRGKSFVWIGSEGCVSPLHRDRLNVFMMQIRGRKRVLLIDATSTHLIYNFESFFSEVDADAPDLKRFPDFSRAKIAEVVLEAGEALFIPANWWHHVRSLTASINISLTNFSYPNDFEAIFDRGLGLG
jgi:ribosomal protein L16 Arg81 hydroxylase